MSMLRPEFFRRIDERPDDIFYSQSRLVNHIDDGACAAAQSLYDELLPENGNLLDLMASYHSHLPDKFSKVIGLGLNRDELNLNPMIDDVVIHDLNAHYVLPFDKESFDGVVCTVSVQYMTHPLETFAQVARCLRKGTPFVVCFSNRLFPSKAVLAWRSSCTEAHKRLVKHYFESVTDFGEVQSRYYEPENGDPLYAVWAYKQDQ